jgi:hypothetical protein
MWKKKELKKEFKPTNRVEHRNIKINVQYTNVKVYFSAGDEFITRIYGHTYQWVWASRDGKPNEVGPAGCAHKSIDMARDFLCSINANEYRTVVDDQKEISVSRSDKICKAEIMDTQDYEVDFCEAYLVDIGDKV